MAEPRTRSWTWTFESPPEAVWPLLADTARFNEAAGLPKHEIEERPRDDGSVLYLGRARMGPFRLDWRERPVNWISGRWFEHRRDFSRGPLARLTARFRLEADGAGGARGRYELEAAPRGLLGRLILAAGFFESAGRTFSAQAASADRFARGLRETPFDYAAPEPAPGVRDKAEALAARIEESGHGHGLAARLAEHLLAAQEVDLARLRPLALARQWGVAARQAVELCLESARAGLLVLRWDLLCPNCRVAKATVGSLDELPAGAHCPTCNIDYGRDFSRNVELSFQPAPALRPIDFGEYCLFGPMSTPHVHAQITLGPGESREVEAGLRPGAYRLRTLEPGPERDVEVDEGGFPEVVAEEEAMTAGPPGPPGRLRLANRTARELTLIIEERHWVRDALTADRAATFQAFRDLFSDQVLRPGDEVSVGRVALMFTDLSASTALYGAVGDAAAYGLVREHFAVLTGAVRAHDGAVVKTIGDAVMAAFSRPADALAAALAVQRAVAVFNLDHGDTPIAVKIGLHEGPSIAVTLNERLDYFGSTVNLAARLQGQSRGGEIVLSRDMAADPEAAALLEGVEFTEEAAPLKGFDQPVPFLRLRP